MDKQLWDDPIWISIPYLYYYQVESAESTKWLLKIHFLYSRGVFLFIFAVIILQAVLPEPFLCNFSVNPRLSS